MYNALRHKLDFEVDFITWPKYDGEKTYAEIAQRVINENRIEDGDIIGGSSLGGMISLEMSQLIRPKAIVLIGSAVSSNEVQGLLALLAPLAVVTPISIVQILAGKQTNIVSTMFAESETEFIRAMCSYLPRWPGYRGRMDNVYRLHGRQDHVIPCPASGATVVESAGHLIAMTHPGETAAFLTRVKSQLILA
jgi:esterase/lipase